MIVRDAHQSGRFDASAAQATVMLGGLAKAANVGVVTEAKRIEAPSAWGRAGDETKVLWDAAKWKAEAHGTEVIPTPTWKRGTGVRTSVEITWALLRHSSGLLLLRGGGHLPAHLYRPSQKRANQAALDALADVLEPLLTAHKPNVATFSFDFNRDLRSSKQRQIIREAVTGTGLALVVPPKGTHGFRKIDGFLTTGGLPRAEMLPKRKGFDHRGIGLRLCGCSRAV